MIALVCCLLLTALLVIVLVTGLCMILEYEGRVAPICFGLLLFIILSKLTVAGYQEAERLKAMKCVAYDMAADSEGCTVYVNDVLITDVGLRYCLDAGYTLTFLDEEHRVVKFKAP